MLTIRFLRQGRKKQPFFKIIVVDKRRGPKSGRFTEEIGFFNPLTKEKGIKKERVLYWIDKGATISDSVYNLFIKEGVIKGQKKAVHKKSKKKNKQEETQKAQSEGANAVTSPSNNKQEEDKPVAQENAAA